MGGDLEGAAHAFPRAQPRRPTLPCTCNVNAALLSPAATDARRLVRAAAAGSHRQRHQEQVELVDAQALRVGVVPIQGRRQWHRGCTVRQRPQLEKGPDVALRHRLLFFTVAVHVLALLRDDGRHRERAAAPVANGPAVRENAGVGDDAKCAQFSAAPSSPRPRRGGTRLLPCPALPCPALPGPAS